MTNSTTLRIPRPDQLPRARPTPEPVLAVPTTDVFVALRAAGGFAGWALQIEAGEPVASWVPGGALAATEVVLGLLEDLARPEDVRLAVHSASSVLVPGAGSIPGVLAYPACLGARDGRRLPVVRRAEEELIRALSGAPRLEVAADGSWGRGSRSAGYGFLAADGTHGSGASSAVGTSAVAELRAVRLALSTLPAERRLTLRCDSRAALSWLQDASRVPGDLHAEVAGVQRLARGRDIRFRWVKGHSGAGLHDGADRLAVAARRALEAGLGHSAPARQTGQIVAESLAAHAAAGSASAAPAGAVGGRVPGADTHPCAALRLAA